MILTEPVTIHEASCIILDDVSSTHSGLNNSSDGDGDRNVEKTNLHDNTKVSLHSTNDLIESNIIDQQNNNKSLSIVQSNTSLDEIHQFLKPQRTYSRAPRPLSKTPNAVNSTSTL
nr:unnamed protein product [Naegleria fowleri]